MSVGEFLRKTREAQKLTLEEVSEKTNIRVKYLEAIESGDLSIVPSLSQARGFTRLYASSLGLNPLGVFEQAEGSKDPAMDLMEPLHTESEPGPALQGEETSLSSPRQVPVKKAATLSAEIFQDIGVQLSRQREKLGLSREDVERQTKIREFYLFAIEQGDISSLPSTVQGRGMLINYASFLNLDSDSFQLRFAEGLQQQRIEKMQIDERLKKTGKSVVGKEPLTGWRRLLTPDLVVGGGLFLSLFLLVIWGAYQVIRSSTPQNMPTIESISEVLIGTPGAETLVVNPSQDEFSILTGTPEVLTTPLVDLQATLAAMQQGPIQLVIYAHQRAYVRVTVDGREMFNGRVVPGNAYPYTGSQVITVLTGNAGGIQLFYNQVDLGIVGQVGQVENLVFTIEEMVTATPRFTPTTTRTSAPTLTPLPTRTPEPTIAVPTPTITPLIP